MREMKTYWKGELYRGGEIANRSFEEREDAKTAILDIENALDDGANKKCESGAAIEWEENDGEVKNTGNYYEVTQDEVGRLEEPVYHAAE